MAKKQPKQSKPAPKFSIIANKSYGLYAGLVQSFAPGTGNGDGVVVATEVRHIARWYGKTGGITSLAAHGLCGSQAAESRIGAPAASATLTGIVNVFECSAEARATIEAAKQS